MNESTRFILTIAAATTVSVASLIVLGAAPQTRDPMRSRTVVDGGGPRQGARVCDPLGASPELVLLVHRARGRYCMW